jgi:hypothetical protein
MKIKNRKLVAFNSADGSDYQFYALVHECHDDAKIQELTAAAISDANKQDVQADLGSVDFNPNEESDKDNEDYSVQARIKRFLAPLGFEFLDDTAVVQTVEWDRHEQPESLLAMRVLHEGMTSEENNDGWLDVLTDDGLFKLIQAEDDPASKPSTVNWVDPITWSFQPHDKSEPVVNGVGFNKFSSFSIGRRAQSHSN